MKILASIHGRRLSKNEARGLPTKERVLIILVIAVVALARQSLSPRTQHFEMQRKRFDQGS